MYTKVSKASNREQVLDLGTWTLSTSDDGLTKLLFVKDICG